MSSPTTTSDVPILVTGGTGTLGTLVVDRLLAGGRRVRVLSRGRHAATSNTEHVVADLNTGEGVGAALKDVEIVLHLAGTQKGDDVRARNLVNAAKEAGVRHLVYISVVGADRINVKTVIDRGMFAYFASKRAGELVIEQSGVPWTTLRATQFDQSFLKLVQGMAKLPIMPVPSGWKFQPIDAAEVADRLVELASGAPSGYVAEMGGPHVYALADMARLYLHAAGKRRVIMPMPTPGGAARELKSGANLTPSHAVGRQTWEQFLADEVGGLALSGTGEALSGK